MKKSITVFVFLLSIHLFSQEPNALLKELSESSCQCIDSIDVVDKTQKIISKEINSCIKDNASTYQFGKKIMQIDTTNVTSQKIEISVNENSDEFKKFYYEMERYLFENCESLKKKISSFEKRSEKSISRNPRAVGFYTKGQDEINKNDFEKAIEYFEKAVEIDSTFAFAWDNIGVLSRKLGNYDKAIKAYNNSLKVDPNGLMPLQNLAIVYQYKKEYLKAIKTYERLKELNENNPEIYYGIGQIYSLNLGSYEKGLNYICKAYIIYAEQKSPYRTDAEKIISIIYREMKKEGKEEKFNEILKLNNITPN